MSSAGLLGAIVASWVRNRPRRYGFALLAVCAAISVQKMIEREIGFPHSFLLFYPTILFVGLLAGFWPGVVSTFLSALAAIYFYTVPRSSSTFSDETEGVGLGLFVLIGIAISWLADSVRKRTNRLQEFEKALEGVEEMIIVSKGCGTH